MSIFNSILVVSTVPSVEVTFETLAYKYQSTSKFINIPVLGRAIHSLAKLGDDLYIEATENELFFRTVNSSKTAYASYAFAFNFFSFYCCESKNNGKKGSVKCQISMRSALSVFRSPLTLDKTTESLQIQFQLNSDKIIFIVKYKKGVLKTFSVPVIDCEALQAYYHKDSLPNSITIQPKIVGQILSNFQNHQDEITWKVMKNNMVIKNYSEPDDDCKGMRTEIVVEKDEFDNYQIETETEVTFCLKELRAVLLFSDSVSLPLTANFNVSSKPIVFIIKSDNFEVNIVVSTLSGANDSTTESVYPSKSFQQEKSVNSTPADEIPGNSSPDNATFMESPADNYNDDDDLPVQSNSFRTSSQIQGREKLKQVFMKCFSKDEHDFKNLPGYDVILASDSDPESES